MESRDDVGRERVGRRKIILEETIPEQCARFSLIPPGEE
jgi:hypothetical protein